MELCDAMDYLDARLMAVLRDAAVQALTLFDQEGLERLIAASLYKTAVTLEQEYGPQIAAEFADWERGAQKWIQENEPCR